MTQKQRIFEHLKRHGSITAIEALNLYGVFRLAARVEELRAQGHGIETKMVSKANKKAYARYVYHSKAAA